MDSSSPKTCRGAHPNAARPARLSLALLVLVLGSLLAPQRAGAENAAEVARRHYQRGNAFYNLEKFAEALSEYERAFVARADPSFLFNIAQCHRQMGHSADAIRFYKRYLKKEQNPENRAIAQHHIRTLEAAPATSTPPPPPPAAPAEPAPSPAPGPPPPTETAPRAGEPERPPAESGAPAPTGAPAGTAATATTPGAGASSTPQVGAPAPPRPERPQALELAIGVYVFRRDLAYRDRMADAVSPYKLSVAPAVTSTIDWFPGALATSGPGAHIGLTAAVQYTMPTSIELEGRSYPNHQWSYFFGAKGRVPVQRVVFFGSLGYGADNFLIDDATTGEEKPMVPDVQYRFVRGEAALRALFTQRVSAQIAGGYRYLLSAGEIATPPYFGNMTAAGWESSGTIYVVVARGIELRLTADFKRYVMVPLMTGTRPLNATGIIDQYVGGIASVAVLVGGPNGL